MPKSPLATVTERFKNKEALIEAVKGLATDDLWIDRVNDDKGLPRISNRKLLHLHDVLSQVKKDHGSRAKLITAIVENEKRGKDAGYRTHLEGRSTPELLATYQLSVKRTAPPKPKAPRTAKPAVAAKKAAPKKKAAAKKAAPKKAGASKRPTKKK